MSPVHSEERVLSTDAHPDFPIETSNAAATDKKMSSLNSDSEEQSDNKEVEDESKKGEKRTRNVQE